MFMQPTGFLITYRLVCQSFYQFLISCALRLPQFYPTPAQISIQPTIACLIHRQQLPHFQIQNNLTNNHNKIMKFTLLAFLAASAVSLRLEGAHKRNGGVIIEGQAQHQGIVMLEKSDRPDQEGVVIIEKKGKGLDHKGGMVLERGGTPQHQGGLMIEKKGNYHQHEHEHSHQHSHEGIVMPEKSDRPQHEGVVILEKGKGGSHQGGLMLERGEKPGHQSGVMLQRAGRPYHKGGVILERGAGSYHQGGLMIERSGNSHQHNHKGSVMVEKTNEGPKHQGSVILERGGGSGH